MCILPIVMIPFIDVSSTSENRKLSEKPSIVNSDGDFNSEWSSEFETYLSEHFAFRQVLVTLNSLVLSDLFKSSSNEKVIVGKNDWLFFASTVDDYTSNNTMSARKLNNTLKTISLMQEYADSKGSKFIFLIAPNKNSVYPEYMPYQYIEGKEKNNRELLLSKMDDYSINSLDITGLFKSSDDLYHTRDSHWTNKGALLVYNSVMDMFEVSHYDFSDVEYCSQNIWSGDLDTMLFPSLNHLSEQIVYNYDFNFQYTSNFKNEDDILITTKNDNGNGKMLMFRDSFGRSLYPFFAENCSEAEFSREVPYRMDLLDSFDAEMTILEIVERNLNNISESTPVMRAPRRELNTSADIIISEANSCFINQCNNMLKIYGRLDESYFQDDSNIYITLENQEKVLCYEAFPICEAELLEENEQSDFGYSLFISLDELSKQEYAVNAYIGDANRLICTDVLEYLKIE